MIALGGTIGALAFLRAFIHFRQFSDFLSFSPSSFPAFPHLKPSRTLRWPDIRVLYRSTDPSSPLLPLVPLSTLSPQQALVSSSVPVLLLRPAEQQVSLSATRSWDWWSTRWCVMSSLYHSLFLTFDLFVSFPVPPSSSYLSPSSSFHLSLPLPFLRWPHWEK
jgi:hypothetical protein